MPSAGAASASRTAAPRSRRSRAAAARRGSSAPPASSLGPSPSFSPRPSSGIRSRSTFGPEVGEQRRQQGDRGEHHHQHGERGRERDPVHVGQPGQEEPEDGDHHRAAGDDHAAPGGGDRLDHGVVAILAVVHRRAEAGQHQQRVVDPDADPDQPRDRRGPVGDVDRRWPAARSGRRRRCRGRRARSRAAGPRRRSSRRRSGARSRRRGSRCPRGSTGSCACVDRIAAELDLQAAAAVVVGGGDQLLALVLGDLPAGDRQRQRASWRSCRSRRRGSGVCGSMCSTCSASAKKALQPLAAAAGWRAVRVPSRRRRSPARSSRRSARSVRSLAAFDSEPGVL